MIKIERMYKDEHNRKTCPICGQDNNCQHGKSDCWCTKVKIPKGLLDLVPDDKKERLVYVNPV